MHIVDKIDEDIDNVINKSNSVFRDIYLSGLENSIEHHTTHKDTDLNNITNNIKTAKTFIVTENQILIKLIDQFFTRKPDTPPEEIIIAIEKVNKMATEMKKNLKTIIDSQTIAPEIKAELKTIIDSQEAGKKLYHRKRKSSRKGSLEETINRLSERGDILRSDILRKND